MIMKVAPYDNDSDHEGYGTHACTYTIALPCVIVIILNLLYQLGIGGHI